MFYIPSPYISHPQNKQVKIIKEPDASFYLTRRGSAQCLIKHFGHQAALSAPEGSGRLQCSLRSLPPWHPAGTGASSAGPRATFGAWKSKITPPKGSRTRGWRTLAAVPVLSCLRGLRLPVGRPKEDGTACALPHGSLRGNHHYHPAVENSAFLSV